MCRVKIGENTQLCAVEKYTETINVVFSLIGHYNLSGISERRKFRTTNLITMPNKLEDKQAMPLIKVQRKFQITIPSSVRKSIPINEGDLIEATARKDGILLKPQTIVDRKATVEKLKQVLARKVKGSPYAGMSDDKIMAEAIKIVEDVRTDRKVKKKSKKL